METILLTSLLIWNFFTGTPKPVPLPILEPTISVTPSTVQQGESFLITLPYVKEVKDIKSGTLEGKRIAFFSLNGRTYALIGIDIRRVTGTLPIVIELKSGEKLESSVQVVTRKKDERILGIPDKLGGESVQSQHNLVASLQEENQLFTKLLTENKPIWSESFMYPLKKVKIADPYGTIRKTGQYEIAHKGTDFDVDEGTAVFATNKGIVRVAKEGRTYGKTVVIDHGLGVQSFYLHLSQIDVKEGDVIERGQQVGLSGQTGYATAPHLHFSIRIYGSSVDPVKFIELSKTIKIN